MKKTILYVFATSLLFSSQLQAEKEYQKAKILYRLTSNNAQQTNAQSGQNVAHSGVQQPENPYTADLINAVVAGDHKLVAHYLEFGADINKKIAGETVLMLAIREAAQEAQEFYGTTVARMGKDTGLFFVSFIPFAGVNYLLNREENLAAGCLAVVTVVSSFYRFYKMLVANGRLLEQTFKGRRARVITELLKDKKIDLKAKNAAGQTALDIVQDYMVKNSQGGCLFRTMRRIETLLLNHQATPAGAR